MNQRTPGQTAIGIIGSRSSMDAIIAKFDLARVYHSHHSEDTRKSLSKYTDLQEDKKSGIITISVTDTDKGRAQAIAAEYIAQLDSIVNHLGESSAGRERVFLQQRLAEVKAQLDQSSQQLSQFSSRNATMDPAKQGQAMVESAARLQGELIAAQSELSALETTYAPASPQARQAQARVGQLQSKLNGVTGNGSQSAATTAGDAAGLPSLRRIPVLGATYLELYRKVEAEATLYEMLSKQYELTRIQEAKEIPPVRVLDAPSVPDKHSSPHRSIIVLIAAVASFLGAISWILASSLRFGLAARRPAEPAS
jgi:uncharacterized protein involved in exopolysaccharide biosynthesis